MQLMCGLPAAVEKIVEVEKPAPTADAGADADSQAWLVFGLPSVPRKQDMDYLSATIDFILDQLPADPSHPLFGKVRWSRPPWTLPWKLTLGASLVRVRCSGEDCGHEQREGAATQGV